MTQPGMHPDADTLTAFAEQLLTASERDQVLAHAAVCSRCREVIFLAEQASEGAPVTKTATPSASTEKPRSWWWGGWRWAWIPAGAFAALIGVVVVLHFRSVEKQTQMAQNSAPVNLLPQVAPSSVAKSVPAKPAETNAPQKAKPQIARDQSAIQEKEEALDRKATIRQRESTLGAAAPPKALSPGAVGGSVHGTITARANSTPFGGPMANELQQNVMQQQNAIQQQNNVRQGLLQSAQGFNQPADKRKAPGQAPVAATAPSISVQAEEAKAAPMAAPPTPPTQLSYAPMSKALDLSPAATAQLKKAARIYLPGGAQPLSVAIDAGRAVALDASGALFVSEDHGKHWQPVATQWTGRAVLVRTLQQNKDNADILQSIQVVPAGKFELVNDKLQTWKSPDGKTWTAETTPTK